MKKIFQINDFNLIYTDSPKMDGGGTSIGLDFVNLLDQQYTGQKFNRCLEWCSGPGFIGFNLLTSISLSGLNYNSTSLSSPDDA